MLTLLQTLNDTEEAVLATIAATWGMTDRPKDPNTFTEQLAAVMLSSENAEQVWDKLPDDQRQALQTLLGGGGNMQMSMFNHLFGEVRKMGRGQVDREQPHKNPTTAAEALFYKGLISETIRMGGSGSQMFAFVPDDLVLVLPTHKTAYDNLEAPPSTPDPLSTVDPRQLNETRPADTSIVDDMTALLAFTRLHTPPVENDTLAEGSLRALMPHLLTHGTERVAFMVTVGLDAGLITVQSGRAAPNPQKAPAWLKASRSDQLKTLIDAWTDSELYRELWHVPGLGVESADGYDPRLGRRVLVAAMKEAVPSNEWWEVDEFVEKIRLINPDFQRPNGDYDSWYVLDMAEEYARGFDSWETVEGAQLEFTLSGPMHWLGLVDISPNAARLTAYGRGVIGMAAFPRPQDTPEAVVVQEDGTLVVSRKVSRLDRFQIARFTSWQDAPPLGSDASFIYTIDRAGLSRADAQDISVEQIGAFVNNVLNGAPIPERIQRVLANWHGGGDTSTVTLEQVIVMRVTSSQVLDELLDTPEVRRYLGARLGEHAVIVRADQWEPFQDVLEEMGIHVEIRE